MQERTLSSLEQFSEACCRDVSRLLLSIVIHLVARIRRGHRLHVDIIVVDGAGEFVVRCGTVVAFGDAN